MKTNLTRGQLTTAVSGLSIVRKHLDLTHEQRVVIESLYERLRSDQASLKRKRRNNQRKSPLAGLGAITKKSKPELKKELLMLERFLQSDACTPKDAKVIGSRLAAVKKELLHRVSGIRRPIRVVSGGATGLKR